MILINSMKDFSKFSPECPFFGIYFVTQGKLTVFSSVVTEVTTASEKVWTNDGFLPDFYSQTPSLLLHLTFCFL